MTVSEILERLNLTNVNKFYVNEIEVPLSTLIDYYGDYEVAVDALEIDATNKKMGKEHVSYSYDLEYLNNVEQLDNIELGLPHEASYISIELKFTLKEVEM